MPVAMEIVPLDEIYLYDYAGRMTSEEVTAHGELVTELDTLFEEVSYSYASRDGDYNRQEVWAPVQGEIVAADNVAQVVSVELFDRLTKIQYEDTVVAYEIVDPQEVRLRPTEFAEVPRFRRPRLKWLNRYVVGEMVATDFEPEEIRGITLVVTPEFAVGLREGQPRALTIDEMRATASFVRGIDQVKDVYLGQLHSRRPENGIKVTQYHTGSV